MTTNSVQLSYTLEASEGFMGWVSRTPLAEIFASSTTEPVRCIAMLGQDSVWLFRGGAHDRRLGIDLTNGARLFLNEERKEYGYDRRGIPARELVEHVNADLRVAQRFAGRQLELGNRDVRLERFDVEHPEVTVESWVVAERLAPALQTQVLWALLCPGIPPDTCAKVGVPGELIIWDPKDAGTAAFRLRLAEIGSGKEAPSVSPESIPQGWRDQTVSDDKRPMRPQRPTPRPAPPARDALRIQQLARIRAEAQQLELAQLRARHAQRASGQDAAWVVGQPVLDMVTNLVNTFAAPFTTLPGSTDPYENAHADIDWWGAVGPHLDPSILDCLKMLTLSLTVMEGARPIGLHPQEIGDYDRDVLANLSPLIQKLYGDGAARAFNFFTGPTFSQARQFELAQAQFAAFTKPYRLDLGFSELGDDSTNFIVITASNFDFEVTIDGGPVIDGLEFVDGAIRLALTVKHLHASFDFETHADDSVGSFLCGLFTFGICTALQTNSGSGDFEVEAPKLVFDVTPSTTYDGIVSLQATLNRAATEFDMFVTAFGANLIQDFVVTIYTWWTSRSDGLNARIFDAVDDAINTFLDLSVFNWPALWHTTSGPPIAGTTALLSPGSASWEADLASTAGLFGGVAADVDPQLTAPLGYVLSQRFLTAWVRELVWFEHEESDLGHIYGLFGVDFVDPRTLDAPERAPADDPFGVEHGRQHAVEGCEPPPKLPPGYFNRIRRKRSAPAVVFPDQGSSAVPGRIEIHYEVDVSAVRSELVAYSQVVPHGECVDLRTPPEPGRPWEVGGRRPGGITAAVAAGIKRAQRGGLPEGMTAGEVAARRRDLELLRHPGDDGPRDGADPQARPGAEGRRVGEGDIVVPGRPGGPGGSPEPPGGPDVPRPGTPGTPTVPGVPPPPSGSDRPALPDVVCEPPHCEWFSYVHDEPLKVYLHADVVVSCDLHLGFNTDGSMWIPEIALALASSGGNDARPLVSVTNVDVSVAAPLDTVPHDTVVAWVSDLCLGEALTSLAPGLRPTLPAVDRRLVPDILTTWICPPGVLANPDLILDLVHYSQAGGSTGPSFTVMGDLLYWPIEIEEHITTLLQ